MIWALIAAAFHIIENVIIANTIRDIHPAVFAVIFYMFSSSFLFVYHLMARKKSERFDVSKALHHKGLVMGYIGGAMFGNVLWYASLYTIGLGATAFVLVFIRILVAGYSYFFMNDRFTADRMVAFLTGFGALILMSFSGGEDMGRGVVFAFVSCFCFSAEVICKKKLALHHICGPNIVMLRNFCLMVCAALIVFGAYILGYIEPQAMNVGAIPFHIIALAAFLGGVLTNVISFYALRSVQLSQYESLETVKPVILALCGVFILDEKMALIQFFYGGIIILSSVYFLTPHAKVKSFLRDLLKFRR